MATVNGVNAAKFQSVPKDMIPAAEQGGRLRVMKDLFEASALGSTDIINIGAPLPKGARIYNVKVAFDDLGTSTGTFKVGDAADDDRFLTAFATGSAGKVDMFGANGVIDNIGYELPADTQLIATRAGAAATGTVIFVVEYAID